jgi:hypothetical protein
VLGDLRLPTFWLSEIFVNLALHAFVATRLPASLPTLEVLSTVGRPGSLLGLLSLQESRQRRGHSGVTGAASHSRSQPDPRARGPKLALDPTRAPNGPFPATRDAGRPRPIVESPAPSPRRPRDRDFPYRQRRSCAEAAYHSGSPTGHSAASSNGVVCTGATSSRPGSIDHPWRTSSPSGPGLIKGKCGTG